MLVCAPGVTGCADAKRSPPSHTHVYCREAAVDIGTIALKGSASATCLLVNPTSRPVAVRLRSLSCDCLSVEFPESILQPGGSMPLTIRVDLSHGEHFPGDLDMEIEISCEAMPTCVVRAVARIVQAVDREPAKARR